MKASAVELLEVMIEEANENSKTLAMSTMKAFWVSKGQTALLKKHVITSVNVLL